jgi:hypothetical protein
MSTTTALPKIVTEVHRRPDAWGFHFIEPSPEGDTWGMFPFVSREAVMQNRIAKAKGEPADNADLGPMYHNRIAPVLLNEEDAEVERRIMRKAGYLNIALVECPDELQKFIIHQQAPAEWQNWLLTNDLSEYPHISVWVQGEFPTI